MKFLARIEKVLIGARESSIVLGTGALQGRLASELDDEKEYQVTIDEMRKRRSLRQNALLWELIHEIDRKINGHALDEISVYKALIQMARIRTEVLVMSDEAKEELVKRKVFRVIEFIEQRGIAKAYRCYYGSSRFDTAEMSLFIDATLYYAEQVGIDTSVYGELRA